MRARHCPSMAGYVAVMWVGLLTIVLAISDRASGVSDLHDAVGVLLLGVLPAAFVVTGLLWRGKHVGITAVGIGAAGFWLLTAAGSGVFLLFGFAPSALLATACAIRMRGRKQ
jgi:hypothetical protein